MEWPMTLTRDPSTSGNKPLAEEEEEEEEEEEDDDDDDGDIPLLATNSSRISEAM
jgi:hypothetical protein